MHHKKILNWKFHGRTPVGRPPVGRPRLRWEDIWRRTIKDVRSRRGLSRHWRRRRRRRLFSKLNEPFQGKALMYTNSILLDSVELWSHTDAETHQNSCKGSWICTTYLLDRGTCDISVVVDHLLRTPEIPENAIWKYGVSEVCIRCSKQNDSNSFDYILSWVHYKNEKHSHTELSW